MEELIPTLQEEGEERIDTLQESSIIAGVQSINGKAGDLDLKTINNTDLLTAGNLDLATAEQLAGKQDILTAGDNIQIENNVISATDSTYTAGNGLDLTDGEFSIDENVVATKTDLADKQDKLTQTQLTAVNSGIDSAKVTQIGTNQNDISTINGKIPNQASTTNQLADKAFVNSSVQTATANFRGSWEDWDSVPSVAGDYPADYTGSTTPTVNDYMVVQDASDYPYETLDGTWRFKYTGSWSSEGKEGWIPEYQVNETPLTAAQIAALNSGITASLVDQITENKEDITSLQTGKMNANTTFWGQSVQNGAVDGTLTLTESGQTATIATSGHNTTDAGIKMGNSKNYVEAGVAAITLSSTTGNINLKPKSGSSVDVMSSKITNLATPTANTDASTKKYVDDGLAAKQDTLTAGTGIDITSNVVSATDPAPAGFFTSSATVSGEGTNVTLNGTGTSVIKDYQLKGDTYQFTTTGKNKIDYLTAVPATAQTTTTFVTNGFRSVTTSSGYATKITMSIKPSTTYALSWDLSIEAQCSPFIRVYKGTITTSGNYVSQNVTSGAGSLSFTTDSDATDINIWFYNGSPAEGTTVWTFIQLEENTSATSYEPYTAGASPNPEYPQDIHVVTGDQTVTIGSTSYTLSLGSLELAKIGSYQDYIYKSGGNWYKHAEVGKVVLDGSENWSRDTTSGGETRYFRLDIADLIMLDASVLFPGYSNYYLPATGNAVYLRQVDYGVAVAGNTGRLRIRNKDIEATADFQTWLSTHNTTVYYALDTATDIQITDAGLIAQLEALWNARTVNGQTIITNSAVSPNLAAILTVDAFTNGWAGTNAGFTEEIARLEARVEALEA